MPIPFSTTFGTLPLNAKDNDGYTPLDADLYYEPEQEKQAKVEIADFLRDNSGETKE